LGDLEPYLAQVEAVLADAEVRLETDLGGYVERTTARLWRGQVLVDWEPDATAGDCLLRADLLRRLIALHASVTTVDDRRLLIRAPGRVVAAVSAEHADLVKRLGGARRVELQLALRFQEGSYRGGEETYLLVERGQTSVLLRLVADVTARAGSPRTSPTRS
jgi:hypothetical protein